VQQILIILTKGLAHEVRQQIVRRVEDMCPHLTFLKQKQDPNWKYVRGKGWSRSHLEVVCCLNAFYQVVLGPLASSARGDVPLGLGETVPILYGEDLRFDRTRSRTVRQAYDAFLRMMSEFDVQREYLTASYADDVVFQIAKYIKKDEAKS